MNTQLTNITFFGSLNLNKWLILIGLGIAILVCLFFLGVHGAFHIQGTAHTLHLLANETPDTTGPIGGGH